MCRKRRRSIYRLASGLRDGQAGDGEFRLAQAIRPGAEPGARWYRLQARTFSVPSQRQPLAAWQLADISRERAEQERFFLDLQKAIDHLDHAPAGFFAADQEGRVTYINATLAEWLGIDLASFTPGDTTLAEIVAGDGMALVRSVKADPGATRERRHRSRSCDCRPARRCRCASCTALRPPARARPARAAPSCSTAISARTLRPSCRASEIRFTRFFNSTPMAIAGVDQQRPHRAHQRAVPVAVLVGRRPRCVDRRVRLDTVIHERDRAAFAAALEKAKQRQADIAPIDTVLPDNEERHIRFYVNAIADGTGGEGAEEAAIVYAVETTEQKALEDQDGAEPEDAGGRPAGRRHRA